MSENPFLGDFKFEDMDLNSFLDQAYRTPRPSRPVTPELPAANAEELLQNIDVGRHTFVAVSGTDPFAVLLNPMDKLDIQMWADECMDMHLWENPEEAPHLAYGMLMQPATWIESGMYQIVSKEDYDQMNRPGNII